MLPELLNAVLYVTLITLLFLRKDALASVRKLVRRVRKRVAAWKFLFYGADMITAEYAKAHGKAFEVPGPDHNHIFVSSSTHMSEIRKAHRDELSMFGATKQMFQPTYTMLGHNWLDERGAEGIGYVRAVGTLFPRQLLHNMPDMQSLVRQSFDAFAIAHTNTDETGRYDLPAYELNKQLLCRLNGFCFFGDELTQNDFFMEKIFEYNELVIKAAEVLRVLPGALKRILGPWIGRHSSVQDKVFKMISEVVARRLEQKRKVQAGLASSPPPNDMIQWIIDTAPAGLEWGPTRITYEVIAIWFGSVHALSATVTYALFDLCTHEEFIDPLRQEVEGPEFESFMRTTKGLPLMDSFIKESSRLRPIEAMSGRRQALKDFAFSDGTFVKKGDWTCVPAKAMLQDETFFPQAHTFQGFRFVAPDKLPKDTRTVSQPEGPSRYSDLSQNYHAWGIGGIVCPGRFYASVATKLILAHFLKAFDCSLVDQKSPQSRIWRSYVLPRDDVLVRFSLRKENESLA